MCLPGQPPGSAADPAAPPLAPQRRPPFFKAGAVPVSAADAVAMAHAGLAYSPLRIWRRCRPRCRRSACGGWSGLSRCIPRRGPGGLPRSCPAAGARTTGKAQRGHGCGGRPGSPAAGAAGAVGWAPAWPPTPPSATAGRGGDLGVVGAGDLLLDRQAPRRQPSGHDAILLAAAAAARNWRIWPGWRRRCAAAAPGPTATAVAASGSVAAAGPDVAWRGPGGRGSESAVHRCAGRGAGRVQPRRPAPRTLAPRGSGPLTGSSRPPAADRLRLRAGPGRAADADPVAHDPGSAARPGRRRRR